MELFGTLSGGAPVIKKYQASATLATAGVQLHGAALSSADIGSVQIASASDVTGEGMIGISTDTSGTIAATGTSDADTLVSVIVNPDAIIKVKMSGGTAADTALALGTTTAASANGSVLSGVTTLDDGMAWGFSGSNVGIYRVMDDTAGSAALSFPNAVGSGDVFLHAQGFPGKAVDGNNLYWDYTANIDQVRADVSVVDMDNYICLDVEVRGLDEDGRNNSFYHFIQNDHLFASISHT